MAGLKKKTLFDSEITSISFTLLPSFTFLALLHLRFGYNCVHLLLKCVLMCSTHIYIHSRFFSLVGRHWPNYSALGHLSLSLSSLKKDVILSSRSKARAGCDVLICYKGQLKPWNVFLTIITFVKWQFMQVWLPYRQSARKCWINNFGCPLLQSDGFLYSLHPRLPRVRFLEYSDDIRFC